MALSVLCWLNVSDLFISFTCFTVAAVLDGANGDVPSH